MKTKQPTLLGSTGKIPKSRIKSLILIGFLVLALPLLALAAKMAVDLSSRAYLPPSPDMICKAALTKHSFEKPCKPSPTPTSQPRKGDRPGIERSAPKVNSYTVIRFTCVDGFTDTYEVKTCMPEDRLLTYAYSVCDQHSIVKNMQYNDACKLPVKRGVQTPRQGQEAQNAFNKGYKRVKFNCADGFEGEYTTSCRTEEQLRNYVYTSCKSHSICPTRPTPTPSKELTPTPTREAPSTPTPTVTPSINSAPEVSTKTLPAATAGQSYQTGIVASDRDGDKFKMSLSNLPTGLSTGPCSISTFGTVTCYIYGIPKTAGTYDITVVATDVRDATSTTTLKLVVNSNQTTPIPTKYVGPTQ